MAKKVTGYLKLQVPAGSANPSPPSGGARQRGRTHAVLQGFNLPRRSGKGRADTGGLTIFADRSFTFEMKRDGVAFLHKAAKLQKGSQTPAAVGRTVTRDQVRKIAEQTLKI